ncbi:hypothetical protein A7C99_6796 [Trichophyton rubrum]|uniref:Transposase Tc1-like domain-containing protein n=4 Tax=Trichophyton TaxID=5550 RepID=D4AKV4_ARTBC|nr:uncharacterized protein ARB_04949 [Trichophyton benhamiae CBS 112371]KMQ49074.1 Homeodomain-like protein [Trichophyton rubrum]OAL72283.1 hypothetical protein A7D00_3281 [Trichophyton violaceum]EFE36013.1 hypothetical protein ARB_04949 [Trichophyton benhamiae CBS 112371]OAL62219.1 hypothetical protein A7C99_6796 [Trichophyton rubrum]DAA78830.1 TPA_exp: Uncharacterized protein A8136_2615 [Trichophyton benhamiae CBS 112371]
MAESKKDEKAAGEPGEKKKRAELTPFTRGLILGRRMAGASLRQISAALDIPVSTVQNTIMKESSRVDGVSKPRSGRPKKLSDRDVRMLISRVRSNPSISYSELASGMPDNISKSTIYRTLKKHGITNRPVKKSAKN